MTVSLNAIQYKTFIFRCWQLFSKFIFKNRLFEAGTLIFFGSLANNPDLIRCGTDALQELQTVGYTIPTPINPVRIYPGKTGDMSATYAGGWRPGIITIREHPSGGAGIKTYLRHELMHEACWRTCGGKMPIWAQEASAISFSGELAFRPIPKTISKENIIHLQQRTRIGAPLDNKSYQTLSDLISLYDWDISPCNISQKIAQLLSLKDDFQRTGFSYILISFLSGRILDSKGDIHTKAPLGSLLKIPYAASIPDASPEDISRELAASDTEKLLKRRRSVDIAAHQFFISSIQKAALSPFEIQDKENNEANWLPLLGERNLDGQFLLEADLYEAAMMLRSSILYKPDYFIGLSENGFLEGSTLYGESEKDKRILSDLFAMTKTGTISDAAGNPLAGYLMAAWPADSPSYLAVFRTAGARGATNIRRASQTLEKWSKQFPLEFGKIRIRLLSIIPRQTWRIANDQPRVKLPDSDGWYKLISHSGQFTILSSARGSRRERLVSGILKCSPDDHIVILETDPETYADAVMSAEADELKGEAAKAMRAVIVWNGLHGARRHSDTASLCDTSHCMVFMGRLPGESFASKYYTDPMIYSALNTLAETHHLNWLMFSKGGDDRWQKLYSFSDLKRLANEPDILDIQRERTRTGQILIHLTYPETQEVVSCDLFKIKIGLPSCPHTIRKDDTNRLWQFEGVGEGHGLGLSVLKAKSLAESGFDAVSILQDAYGRQQ